MVFGFGKKSIDPRDGKPGNMTARSSLSEKERKRRMAEPDGKEAEPRTDLLKRSGKATYSTVMHGNGLGVMDWVPFQPTVARKWAWEPPDEPAADDSMEVSLEGDLTSIEKAFMRWGRTAPKWMVKAELQYRERFKKKRRRKKKKKEQDVEPAEDPIPSVPIPETVPGLLAQTAHETFVGYTGGVRSRIEYQRRLRQIEGPGPAERAFLDYMVVPLTLVMVVIYEHLSAYWRVNEGFAKKRVKEGEDDDDEEEQTRKIATWRQLELMQQRIQTMAGLAAFVSIIIGVLVNELQFRGFVPAWNEDCANPEASKLSCKKNPCAYYEAGPANYYVGDTEIRYRLICEPPDANKFGLVDRLKMVNTGLTVYIMFTEYFYYRYETNIMALRNHIEFQDGQLRSYWLHQFGLLRHYLYELALLSVHQIPTFYRDIIVETSYFSSRPSVYSLDGIIALFMVSRLFQVWKWYRGYLYTRYASRRYAVRLNDEDTGSLLAVRLFVLDNPLIASIQLFLAIVLIGSFVYRIAESSTNEIVGVYYWDCMWFMVDAMTGLPIADKTLEPEGTFGRGIAVAVRFLGILWFILVLSAVKQLGKHDLAETQFFGWIRISSLNTTVKISAARVIQYMWVYGIGHFSTLRQLDRFRIAQQNLRNASKDSENPESADFDVFKRSISSKMADMKKMVETYNEELDKEQDISQHGKDGVGKADASLPRTSSQEKGLDRRMVQSAAQEKDLNKVTATVSGGKFGLVRSGHADCVATRAEKKCDASGSTQRHSRTILCADLGRLAHQRALDEGDFVVNSCAHRKFECARCAKGYVNFQSLRYHILLDCNVTLDGSSGLALSDGVEDDGTIPEDLRNEPNDDEGGVLETLEEEHHPKVSDGGLGNSIDLPRGKEGIDGGGQGGIEMPTLDELFLQLKGEQELQEELQRQRDSMLAYHKEQMQMRDAQGALELEEEDFVEEDASWKQTLEQTLLWERFAELEQGANSEEEAVWDEEKEVIEERNNFVCARRPRFECGICGKTYARQTSLDFHLRLTCSSNVACSGPCLVPEAEMVPSPREHGVGEGLGVDEARRIRVICQGAGFGNSSHTAAQQTRQGDDLELTDVQEEAVLPGQIRALAQGGARTRASGYTRAPADLSVGGGLRNRSHGDPQRITGSRFGDAPGDGGSRAPRRGVQFADIESPRGRPKKKMGIVGGSINYDIILSDKEKSALKARTLSDQVQSALTEMRDLRVANDELLRRLGVEPDHSLEGETEEGEEPEPESWELEMIEKIERVETRFADLDRVVSDMMGQILLLIQGVYIKKGKRVPDLKQEVPSG